MTNTPTTELPQSPKKENFSRDELEIIIKKYLSYNWIGEFSWNDHKPKLSFREWFDKNY